MTKLEIVNTISDKIGVERVDVQAVVEAFMYEVKNSLSSGEDVFLRGFGSFIVKQRAQKTGRNISKNTTIVIPAHKILHLSPQKNLLKKLKQTFSYRL